MSMMLDAARRYLEMKWNVIPLRPGNKEPLIKWHEYMQRRSTDQEISEWFGSGKNNLGLVAGSVSGFVVVDVDGPVGLESAQRIGLSSNTVALTGKGTQFLYRPPSDFCLKNAVRLLPGIDIRSEGGYICAPPSIHPNGKQYTWLMGPTTDLPEFPSALARIANEKNSSQTSLTTPGLLSSPSGSTGWVKDALQGLTEGNRNDTFARVVGKLHHSGLDKTTIWALLLPYAKSCGLDDKELNSVIQSITRYPTKISEQAGAASAESFLADPAPVSWLCRPVIAHESIGFIAGLPESYKTWAAMDLAIECARGGGLWLGLFPIDGGRILFIDQERSTAETRRRFTSLLRGKSLTPNDLRASLFIRAGTTTRLNVDESFAAFKRELADIRPNVVVIDSFRAFHTLNVNDAQSMELVMNRVREIRQEFKCVVMFVDHTNKMEFEDIRDKVTPSYIRLEGAGAKSGAADFILSVRRTDATTCAIYHTKSTMGPKAPGFAVHVVDTVDGGIRVYGEGGVK